MEKLKLSKFKFAKVWPQVDSTCSPNFETLCAVFVMVYMPKNIKKSPPTTQNGEQILKKWRQYNVRQQILSGSEKFCDVLRQK